jgi:hypothetical protein
MKRQYFWVVGLSVMVMSGMSNADQRGTPAGTWTWESLNREPRPLVIRLVRGSVEIRRRAGPVRVEVTRSARLSDPFEAAITVSERSDQILISDRYPVRASVNYRECLPPLDERGDFWSSDVRLMAVVWAPQDLPVKAEIMDHDLRALRMPPSLPPAR